MKLALTDRQLLDVKRWLGTGSINIFGLPFAGKDTHGNELAKIFDAPLLGGGDILRNSTIPPELQASLDAGNLFPTDEYMRIVTPYLSKEEFSGKPLILSSVGRWIGEEQGVIAAAKNSNHPLCAVIYLSMDERTLFDRWEKSQSHGDREGRADDAAHVLENRINEFNQKTLPVIEVYRKLGLLVEVSSEASKDEVLASILSRLHSLATA